MRAAVALCVLCLAACGGPEAPTRKPAAAESAGQTPVGAGAIVLNGVTFVHSKGDAVFARGTFATMTYLRGSGDTVASEASVRFPRDGEPDHAVDVYAPHAHGNPLEEQVVGEGGVRVKNQLGDRGDTAVATLDGKRGEAHGDRPVHLVGPGFVSDSPGFRWHAADDALDLGPSVVDSRGQAR